MIGDLFDSPWKILIVAGSPAAARAPGRSERHASHAGRASAARPERDLSRQVLTHTSKDSEERAMTATTDKLEANKKLARDYIDQVFNQHNPGKAADFVTGDVVWHGGGLGDIAGPDNLAGLLGSFIGALPDLHAAEQD